MNVFFCCCTFVHVASITQKRGVHVRRLDSNFPRHEGNNSKVCTNEMNATTTTTKIINFIKLANRINIRKNIFLVSLRQV